MSKTALIFVCAAGILSVPGCKETERFGAIAISASTGKFGGVIDRGSREQAESDAKGMCAQPDCGNLVVWFKNACVAIAQGAAPNQVFGSTAQPTDQDAQKAALAECSKTGSGCTVAATFCTTR